MFERIVSWFLTLVHLGVLVLVAIIVIPTFARSVDNTGGGYYWFTQIVGWGYCFYFAILTWEKPDRLKVNTKQAAGKNNDTQN